MKSKKTRASSQRVAAAVIEEGRKIRKNAPILRIFPADRGFREIMTDRRFELGYRMGDLGKAVGVSSMMIGKIESGVRNPDIGYLPKIASVLRLDLKEFFYRYIQERNKAIYMAIVPDDRIRELLALPDDLQDVIFNSVHDLYHRQSLSVTDRKRA